LKGGGFLRGELKREKWRAEITMNQKNTRRRNGEGGGEKKGKKDKK